MRSKIYFREKGIYLSGSPVLEYYKELLFQPASNIRPVATKYFFTILCWIPLTDPGFTRQGANIFTIRNKVEAMLYFHRQV